MKNMPQLRELNGQQILYVEDQPFLILGFQLNCDSCYDSRQIDFLIENAKKMGCNSVALLLYWRLIEPREGEFDFTILERMLDAANRHDMRIVLVWFGSYKNATMHYAPDWVSQDRARFRRAQKADGSEIPWVACYNCEELIERDMLAVSKVFEFLRDMDQSRRVILFQVNNETGLLGGTARCHCPVCEAKYRQAVERGLEDEEAFSAACLLEFQERIAQRAKSIYPLPCYCLLYTSDAADE